MTEHPITPPSELVRQWISETYGYEVPVHESSVLVTYKDIATQAARWGADQELEACCEWLQDPDLNVDTYKLRAARRPKAPSLKEQALKAFSAIEVMAENYSQFDQDVDTVRRALEALPDD